jgi:hypothetical protein
LQQEQEQEQGQGQGQGQGPVCLAAWIDDSPASRLDQYVRIYIHRQIGIQLVT